MATSTAVTARTMVASSGGSSAGCRCWGRNRRPPEIHGLALSGLINGRLWLGQRSADLDVQVDRCFGQGPAFPGKHVVRRYLAGWQLLVPMVLVYIFRSKGIELLQPTLCSAIDRRLWSLRGANQPPTRYNKCRHRTAGSV